MFVPSFRPVAAERLAVSMPAIQRLAAIPCFTWVLCECANVGKYGNGSLEDPLTLVTPLAFRPPLLPV